jgi:NAD-dependent histone deacetylase SIR2
MGNEESTMDDSTAPSVLEARTVAAVAKYIKEHDVKRVVVMVSCEYLVRLKANSTQVGAGISTSAGIPDFRSPDTGIYANLAFLDLPEPEDVFDISFFRENPKPFYALAHELYPGRYRPTIVHSFIKLLYDKGMLLKHFTQNIDCLERQAGVPGDVIIEAHGSFASQRCIDCKEPYPDDDMQNKVSNRQVAHCYSCNGLVKPDIVFFGEALPSSFWENADLAKEADLCIVMGTSLSVHPFAGLPQLCKDGTPRVLINMEKVGGLGSRTNDVLLLGDCDTGVRKLAKALGWEEELETLWEGTKPEEEESNPKTRDERLQEEVERLTEDVDRTLGLTDAYQSRVRDRLESHEAHRQSNVGGLAHVFPHLA